MTQITASISNKIENFVRENEITTMKLSSLYNSRSTRYHSIYNSDLFLIKTDAESIAAAGYAKTCKAIITLNMDNEIVAERVKEIREGRKASAERRAQEAAKQAAWTASINEEAASIITDSEFISAVTEADKLNGIDRHVALSNAFSKLLVRLNHKISTDFWKVFKIVKQSI